MPVLRFFHLAAAFMFLGLGNAQAGEPSWATSDHVQGRLVTSGSDIAVQLRLAKGWHTYWRVPGDAGLPPRFDWSGSDNIKSVDIEYPAPERFDEMGLQTFGYADEVAFPGRVQLNDLKQPAHLRLKISVMVCHEICIPQILNFEADLSDQTEAAFERYIKYARKKVPVQGGESPQLKIDTVVAGPDALVISATSAKGFEHADVFATVDNEWALTAKPEITVEADNPRRALIKIPVTEDSGPLAGSLSVTLVQNRTAVERTVNF